LGKKRVGGRRVKERKSLNAAKRKKMNIKNERKNERGNIAMIHHTRL
jgi:hypothetical protein